MPQRRGALKEAASIRGGDALVVLDVLRQAYSTRDAHRLGEAYLDGADIVVYSEKCRPSSAGYLRGRSAIVDAHRAAFTNGTTHTLTREVVDEARGRLSFWVESRSPAGLNIVSYYCELHNARIARQVGIEVWE
jgi:hypothetical protein